MAIMKLPDSVAADYVRIADVGKEEPKYKKYKYLLKKEGERLEREGIAHQGGHITPVPDDVAIRFRDHWRKLHAQGYALNDIQRKCAGL